MHARENSRVLLPYLRTLIMRLDLRLVFRYWLLAAALLAQPAYAQFLYKSTMPDGKVIYGDAPMPGAVKVEKTKPDTSKKGITSATPKEAAALKKLEAERAAKKGTGEPTLEDILRKMEAKREAAREPLEGERIGTAGGGSRFTEAYTERQKKLDQVMDKVRQDLEKSRPGK